MQHNKGQFQANQLELVILNYVMKSIALAFLVIPLLLSASTTRGSQGFDAQPQMQARRSARSTGLQPQRSLTSNPIRSLRGGSPPDPTGSIWGGFANHPARSLWGGFPLTPVMGDTTSSYSSALPSSEQSTTCESTETFCVIEHQFSFQRPFSPIFNTTVVSSYLYGSTQFGDLEPHHGVEIPNPTGTPVLAVDDGTVIVAGTDAHNTYGPWENFYGNLVVLEHHLPGIEEPVYTLYGHLSTVKVKVGETVKGDEPVGEVGATGSAIGSHLHFEVRVGSDQYVDTRNPALWLVPLDNEDGLQYGVLAGKLENAQEGPIHASIKAEYYPDNDETPEKTFYIETYATDIETIKGDDNYQENFVVTDLPPGRYRIALNASGKWTDRWVEIESGKLSFVTIVSK
jgi:murein DD-endopeptidase MepM/ murein hydrolase activator NlpD